MLRVTENDGTSAVIIYSTVIIIFAGFENARRCPRGARMRETAANFADRYTFLSPFPTAPASVRETDDLRRATGSYLTLDRPVTAVM